MSSILEHLDSALSDLQGELASLEELIAREYTPRKELQHSLLQARAAYVALHGEPAPPDSTDQPDSALGEEEGTVPPEADANASEILEGVDVPIRFNSLSEIKREQVLREKVEEMGRFAMMGELIDALEKIGITSNRWALRPIWDKWVEEGEGVILQYGDSNKYIHYGLKSFVMPDIYGGITFASKDVLPTLHSRMTGRTYFQHAIRIPVDQIVPREVSESTNSHEETEAVPPEQNDLF